MGWPWNPVVGEKWREVGILFCGLCEGGTSKVSGKRGIGWVGGSGVVARNEGSGCRLAVGRIFELA